MEIFLVSFVVMVLAVAAMAVGVLLGRPAIKGSCGGVGGAACAGCARPCRRRDGQ